MFVRRCMSGLRVCVAASIGEGAVQLEALLMGCEPLSRISFEVCRYDDVIGGLPQGGVGQSGIGSPLCQPGVNPGRFWGQEFFAGP